MSLRPRSVKLCPQIVDSDTRDTKYIIVSTRYVITVISLLVDVSKVQITKFPRYDNLRLLITPSTMQYASHLEISFHKFPLTELNRWKELMEHF
jgi:hypothetical protein